MSNFILQYLTWRSPSRPLDKCPITKVPRSTALGITGGCSQKVEPIRVNVVRAPDKKTYSLNLAGDSTAIIVAATYPGTRRELLEIVHAKSASDKDVAPVCPDKKCIAEAWTYLDDFNGGKLKELRLDAKPGQWALFGDVNNGKDYTLYYLDGGAVKGHEEVQMVEMVEIDLVPV